MLLLSNELASLLGTSSLSVSFFLAALDLRVQYINPLICCIRCVSNQ